LVDRVLGPFEQLRGIRKGTAMITLSCKEVRREISNYLDDDMSPSMRRLLETHLEQCRKCAVLLDSTHNVLVLLPTSKDLNCRPDSASGSGRYWPRNSKKQNADRPAAHELPIPKSFRVSTGHEESDSLVD
jgi:hypothetical protein